MQMPLYVGLIFVCNTLHHTIPTRRKPYLTYPGRCVCVCVMVYFTAVLSLSGGAQVIAVVSLPLCVTQQISLNK